MKPYTESVLIFRHFSHPEVYAWLTEQAGVSPNTPTVKLVSDSELHVEWKRRNDLMKAWLRQRLIELLAGRIGK